MTLQVSRNTGFYHVGIKGLNEFFRECYHECFIIFFSMKD
jgi:hypothetical protein